MKKVITTVGTSIFSNYPNNFKFSQWSDKTPHDLNGYTRKTADNALDLIKNWATGKENASAEIASLLAIQREINEPIEVYLICTDTALSVMAAECVKQWFQNKTDTFPKVEIVFVPNLLVMDKNTFNLGLKNLFDAIYQIIPTDKDKKDWNDIVLNITGGYKAIIPHLTILGQIYHCPIYYVFEENETQKYDLIEVPTLPISFDWLATETFGQFLSTDTMLNNYLEHEPMDFETLQKYGLVKEEDEKKKVDIFGTLMWQHIKTKTPENPSVMGSFVELKVYEYFNENRGIYAEIPKRSVDFFWNGEDENIIKSPKEGKFKQKRVEIDLILRGENLIAAVEVKSIGQIKHFVEPNDKGRVDYMNKVKTLKTFYQTDFKTLILVIYKNPYFPDSDFSNNEHLQIMKRACEVEAINLKVYVTDFVVNRVKKTLEFSNFLNNPLVLKEIILS